MLKYTINIFEVGSNPLKMSKLKWVNLVLSFCLSLVRPLYGSVSSYDVELRPSSHLLPDASPSGSH